MFLDDPPPLPLSMVAGIEAVRAPRGDALAAAHPALAPGVVIHLSPTGAVVMTHGFPACRVNAAAAEVLASSGGEETVGAAAARLAGRHGDRPERVASLLSGFLTAATGRGFVRFSPRPEAVRVRVSGCHDRWLPYSASLELTRACVLRCAHCYADGGAAAPDELGADEWLSIIDGLAAGGVNLSLTGGEPLLRPDARTIIEHAVGSRMAVGVLTSGVSIDPAAAAWLAAAGIDWAQVSLDGHDPATHEGLRGLPGSFAAATAAVRLLTQAGVKVHAGMTVSTASVDALPATARLARDLGARSLRVGRLLRRGRARRSGLDFTAGDYQRLVARLDEAAAATRGDGFAVAFEGSRDWLATFPGGSTLAQYMEYRDRFARAAGGNCGAGRLAAFISATGEVRPCPVTGTALGTARRGDELWRTMNDGRAQAYGDVVAPGPRLCGRCEHLFRCVACNSEALEYAPLTPGCRWATQVLKGGVTPRDFFAPGAG